MQTPAEVHQPWWVPAAYIFLGALIGAVVGFAADRVKAWFDARKTKKAFLQAIGMELPRLQEQLKGLIEMLSNSQQACRSFGSPHEFAVSLKTNVFDSQLAHIKDLSDPLLFDIVHLYSEVAAIPTLIQVLNERSRDCQRLTDASERARALLRLVPALENGTNGITALNEKISSMLPRLPKREVAPQK